MSFPFLAYTGAYTGAYTDGFPCMSLVVSKWQEEGWSRLPRRKTKPLAGQGVWHRLPLVVKAEGKGFEPSTGCPAPDFESGC